MKKKVKGLLSAFVSFIVSVTSMLVVLPISNTNAVTETTYQNITAEQLKSVQNFILGNSDSITTKIDKTCDVNNDDRIDAFDLCMLKKAYAEQTQKTSSFYSLSSEMVNENDSKYGAMIMSDEFHSKRLIVKADSSYDFSGFSPKKEIKSPDNLYVLQFETVENAELCMNTLQKDKHIEYVELDEYMSCDDVETKQTDFNSWGVEAIEADKYSEYLGNNYDSSVVVAVVDTGVSYHDFLKDRVLDTGYDLVDNDPEPNDKHFHGTHVAGTVVDCTPDLSINIMPVRVLDENGNGSTLNVGNGIRFAAENGADVINLSLGGHGNSRYIDDSIEYAVENGVTVVVAAGNKGDNTINYCPAHLDNCIVVSACDSENNKANFSNYGNSVDVTAPGVDIRSCIPGGSYKFLNGTSMATPHISAVAAMIKYAEPNSTPAEIEQKIKDISLDFGDVGKDVYYGYGLPKLSKLIDNMQIIDSGKCGDNAYYTLDKNGLLTISGTNDIYDYGNMAYNEQSPPWCSDRDYGSNIKNIIIEEGITGIGVYNFYGSAVSSIKLPESLKKIDELAFHDCTYLKEITIPKNVTEIGDRAFGQYGNSGTGVTEGFTVYGYNESVAQKYVSDINNRRDANGNPYMTNKINFVILDADDTIISGLCGENLTYKFNETTGVLTINGTGDMTDWYYSNVPWYEYRGNIKKVNIEYGVTSIGDFAFHYCSALTSITIPDSVTSIGNEAFFGCEKLQSVLLPNSIKSIGDYAFEGCYSLEELKVPFSVDLIGTRIASGKNTYVYVDTNNKSYTMENDVIFSADKSVLVRCNAIVSGEYIVPDSVKKIEDDSFWNCINITKIILPYGLEKIGDSTFYNCSNLTDINIPETCTDIGAGAFSGTSLKELILPDEIKEIKSKELHVYNGKGTLWFCSSDNITDIVIPKSVEYIDNCSFFSSKLQSITILNPDCEIYDWHYVVANTTKSSSVYTGIIYGYKDSTAQAYAEKYGRTFVALD